MYLNKRKIHKFSIWTSEYLS